MTAKKPGPKRSPTPIRILLALRIGPMTADQLAVALDLKVDGVIRWMQALLFDDFVEVRGMLQRKMGRKPRMYQLKDQV